MPRQPPASERRKTRQQQRRTLRLLQVNVGKSGPTHDVALNTAFESDAEVVFIQEPWVQLKGSRKLTKTHPGYDAFAPVEDWAEKKPRTMTYVLKTPGLTAHHIRPFTHPDCCTIVINGITMVNVYRQPGLPPGLLAELETWTTPRQTVVAGDFNAVHWTWQPGHDRHNSPGPRVADWAEAQGLTNLNPLAPTHEAGNTIDLVFTDIPEAQTEVLPDLATGSDHYTLWTTIPTSTRLPKSTLKLTVTDDNLVNFAQLVKRHADRLPKTPRSAGAIDALAEQITQLLQEAVKATGKPRQETGRPTSWWDADCQEAKKSFLAAKRANDETSTQETRRNLRRTVARKKREFWEKRVRETSTDKDMHNIATWHKSADRFRPPPLVDNGRAISDPQQKAEHLRDRILYRFTTNEDIRDPWEPINGPRRWIAWSNTVTEAEARGCCTNTGNTSPGQDGITVRLLQAAWPFIGEAIRDLYESCLTVGYHPTVFRTAEVSMIPKVGKTDYTSYRAYRPIALLSCISKGLERLIAKRMATTAVNRAILNPQHFGALPKRSAVDLTTCLTHDIEGALNSGKEATLLTMDVQGAFDAVLPNRLAKRLREQGWPDTLVRWVLHFVTDRHALVRLDGTFAETRKLVCGVPQGSPISPILYMLYLAPLLQLGDTRTRFAYADDVAILRTGKTTTETTRALARDLREAIRWGRDNAVTYAPDKYELIHFTRKRGTRPAAVKVDDLVIHPTTGAVRWLGVFFDPRLNFRTHVENWGAKAYKAATHLRGLNRVLDGAPPRLTALAANASVLPVATYGTETWWPGPTRPSAKDWTKTAASKQVTNLKILDRAIVAAARAVLPVWKTTPIPILHREAGLPPASVLLEQIRIRAAMRLRTLDKAHPLVERAEPPARPAKSKGGRPHKSGHVNPRLTNLRRMNQLLGPCERPKLLPKRFPPQFGLTLCGKKDGKAQHEAWLKTLPPKTVVIYSDGSENRALVAWGFAAYQDGRLIRTASGRIQNAHVFDAEIRGAAEGMVWASANRRKLKAPAYYSCIDSTSVIQGILGDTPDSSQEQFLRFRYNQLKLAPARTQVRWSPGHVGIKGNEKADQLAGELTSEDSILRDGGRAPRTLPTVSHRTSEGARKRQQLFDDWWKASRPSDYQKWALPAKTRPPELELSRQMLHRLLAERSGHGDFAEYHVRFGHEHRTSRCQCGMPREQGHFVRCPFVKPFLPKDISRGEELATLLGKRGHQQFKRLVEESKAFDEAEEDLHSTPSPPNTPTPFPRAPE